MILTNDKSRCTGFHKPTGDTCPERNHCLRYLAYNLGDEHNPFVWTSELYDPQLLFCTEIIKVDNQITEGAGE